MSITNAQLRWVKSLSKKSARIESGRFFAEGPQSLKALAGNQHWIERIYLTEEFSDKNQDLVEKFDKKQIDLVSADKIDRMADATNPQGVIAVCHLPENDGNIGGQPVVVLEQISDPGNLGTIIRTADASGAGTVILGEGSVDVFSPKVVRSSAGSVFHIEIIQDAQMEQVLMQLKSLDYKLFAADMSGDNFRSANCAQKHAWIFGNEAHGLSSEVLSNCDETFSIPIYGQAESLNLSVAAGVVLYHSAFSKRG